MIRVFVAFPLPVVWIESFIPISKKNSALEKFRWTPVENLHITLFFIGEVEEKNLQLISSALNKTFLRQQAIQLLFESIELRGKKESPSMLWGKFRKNESFTLLAEKIHQSVKEFMTIEVVHQDPIPHCTLARIKPGAEINLLRTEISISTSELRVNVAELWKTVKSKGGVKYERLLHWELIKK